MRRLTPSGSRLDVDAADRRRAARRASAGRTACGSSSTCRRRCAPRKPKISPCRDVEAHVVDGDEVAEPPREMRRIAAIASMAGYRRTLSVASRQRPSARCEPRLGELHAGQRARALELGLQRSLPARRARRCSSPRRRRSARRRRAAPRRRSARAVGRGSTCAARLESSSSCRWRTSSAICESNSASRSRVAAAWPAALPRPRRRVRPPSTASSSR